MLLLYLPGGHPFEFNVLRSVFVLANEYTRERSVHYRSSVLSVTRRDELNLKCD